MTDGTADRAGRRAAAMARVEQVALELFRARGFDAVTVEDISAAAGIGPATFYRYFGTKDGVLFAYRPALLRAVEDAAARVDAALPRGACLLAILMDFAGFLQEHSAAMMMRDDIVAAEPHLMPYTLAVQREWEVHLAGGLARRRGLAEADPATRTDAAVGIVVIRLAFRQWREGRDPSLRRLVAVAFGDVARALEMESDVT